MLIHVIDGTDAHKIGDAAQFLYRVLLNKKYQRCRCHYVLLLNKEDDPGFLGRDRIIKRL